MVLVAPCYKAPKKRLIGKLRPQPKLACPPIADDLLQQARDLYDGGNFVAAAMTARVEIERQLTKLAMNVPSFGEYWQGIATTASWLYKRRFLRKNTFRLTMEATDIGNRAAHGHPVSKEEVMRMFNSVDSLRHTVRRKCGRKAVTA